jgi:hypothetical protein
MTIWYKILFDLGLYHGFYTDSICPDFSIASTRETAALARNNKLIFKGRDNTGTFLFEAKDDAGHPRIQLQSDAVITLILQLNNSDFYGFTDLPVPILTNSVWRYFFDGIHDELQREEISLQGPVFNYTFKISPKPLTIRIKDAAGTVISIVNYDDIYNDHIGPLAHQVNLTGHPKGIYTLDEYAGTTLFTTKIYLDGDLARTNIFGIMNIKASDLDYTAVKNFTITFAPLKRKWTYYIVASKEFDDCTFTVADIGNNADDGTSIGFNTLTLPPSDNNLLLLSNGTNTISAFQTIPAITSRQKPKENIQLNMLRTGSSSKTIIPNLPNPAMDKIIPDMFIFIQK